MHNCDNPEMVCYFVASDNESKQKVNICQLKYKVFYNKKQFHCHVLLQSVSSKGEPRMYVQYNLT